MKIKLIVASLFIFALGFYIWEWGGLAPLENKLFSENPNWNRYSTVKKESSLEAISIEKKSNKNQKKERQKIETQIVDFQKKRNISALVNFYEKHPEQVLQNERASILIARALMHLKSANSFDGVINSWTGRETLIHSWFFLKADKLIYQGKIEQAKVFLNSKTFKGKLDSGRLIRLAIANLNPFPQKAWIYLQKAVDLEPENPDVRSFQAQILEKIGMKELARKEYVAAYLANPGSPLLKNQLAEFYRRNGNLDFALKTWTENISIETPDFIKLKAFFWSRVYKPQKINLRSSLVKEGRSSSLLKFLSHLSPGEFWNEEEFRKVPEGRRISMEQQEVFWFQLLEELNKGDELKALSLLEKPLVSLKYSWNPDLQAALHWILAYRNSKSLYIENSNEIEFFKPGKNKHQFFNQLFKNTRINVIDPAHNPPKSLKSFLQSEEIFSGAFIAAGWMEAAIQFTALVSFPEQHPDWFVYGLTQAYRYNRGNKKALTFARMQGSSNSSRLLIGEILLADGQVKLARKTLKSLSRLDTGEGYRSAWLLSQSYLSANLLVKARRVLLEQVELAESVTGKAILAEIYLSEGNTEKAEQIYSLIVEDSPQAKIYFAKKSFQKEDYSSARHYTELLALEFPSQLQFVENLRKISELETKNEKI